MIALNNRQLKIAKSVLFIFSLLPIARLFVAAQYDWLGPNPVEFITRNTGDWTLYFLCITLAITPLRKILAWNWLIQFRRMLGLFSFFYALCHFMTFLWFDHFFDMQEMWNDVIKRPFITIGFLAFVLLIPMALTSTNNMIKRIGGHQWQIIHRMIYLIVPIGLLHFFWMKAAKNNFTQPILFSVIVTLLLGLRLYWRSKKTSLT